MDEKVLRERMRKFELEIKKHKKAFTGSGSDAEKKQIELKIAEAKASIKRINNALDALGPVKNSVPFNKQYPPVAYKSPPTPLDIDKKAKKRVMPKKDKDKNKDRIAFALPKPK